jgi:hypothetical protein
LTLLPDYLAEIIIEVFFGKIQAQMKLGFVQDDLGFGSIYGTEKDFEQRDKQRKIKQPENNAQKSKYKILRYKPGKRFGELQNSPISFHGRKGTGFSVVCL